MSDSNEALNFFDFGQTYEDTGKRNQYMKAPFMWVGSKFSYLADIIPLLPRRKAWVDHFGGSGVVSLNYPDTDLMVFNDRHSGVVDFYRCVRDKSLLDQLLDYLHKMPSQSREEHYRCREEWVTTQDPVERAAKWFYAVQTSVIGKNHAFARSVRSRFTFKLPPDLELFEKIHYKMKRFIVENLDARVCAKDFDSLETVHYFDPPYLGTCQGAYKHKWTEMDMRELLNLINSLSGAVALSHKDDIRIDEGVKWDKKYTFSGTSRAEVMHAGRTVEHGKVTECLWIKL